MRSAENEHGDHLRRALAGDQAGDLASVGQEADVAGSFQQLEPCARDRRRQRLLLRGGHDRVARTGQHQRRHVNPPEPVRNVERLQQARRRAITLWSVSQQRSTTNSASGSASGLPAWSRLKNWLTNRLSFGNGNRSRRAGRSSSRSSPEPGLGPEHDQAAELCGCPAASSSATAPPNETPRPSAAPGGAGR